MKAFQAACITQEKKVLAKPKSFDSLMQLACIDALLDCKEQALAEGRQALALCSPGKDAGSQFSIQDKFATLLVYTGERDEPIRILQKTCGHPGGPDYGDLRFGPTWDPLHDDPRFEAMVASLAPKQNE